MTEGDDKEEWQRESGDKVGIDTSPSGITCIYQSLILQSEMANIIFCPQSNPTADSPFR